MLGAAGAAGAVTVIGAVAVAVVGDAPALYAVSVVLKSPAPLYGPFARVPDSPKL